MASFSTSAFLPVPPSSLVAKASTTPGGLNGSVNAQRIVVKPMPLVGPMQVKANAQSIPMINEAQNGLKIRPSKDKSEDMLGDVLYLGKIIEDGFVFRQNFFIRSYETGAGRTASIETLMNHLQETSLNHARCAGLLGEGYGTVEMSRRNLIWVVTKMQVHVERYPTWGDLVEVDTWVGTSGKNGMRRSWHLRDGRTGHTVMRATSVWVMMNKLTRRLSKIPDEVRAEILPVFLEHANPLDEDDRKFPKIDDDTADYVRKGLTPHWNDLDVNQHVNNVTYIGWLLQSVPVSIFETRELARMTLEYRRECVRDSVLQSLTSLLTDCTKDGSPDASVECQHLLRLEDGAAIVRGRTEWRLKLHCDTDSGKEKFEREGS